MRQLFSNLASAEISTTSVGTADTTFDVTNAVGLPSIGTDEFWVGVIYKETNGVESDHEVVHVTGQSGSTLTVSRGEEGTSAKTFAAGDRIELRNTAGTLDRIRTTARVNSSAGATIEVSDGDVRVIALTADTTLTDGLNDGESVTLKITGGDSWTITWPTIEWVGDAGVPTLKATHWIELLKVSGVVYAWDAGGNA